MRGKAGEAETDMALKGRGQRHLQEQRLLQQSSSLTEGSDGRCAVLSARLAWF